ncbi:hypothetical protein ACFE04_016400 [Oxalis oulophora]
MPSKLRKAIGAVKDQTSISIAKVSKTNATHLEVAILKATSHEHVPIEERYVLEILQIVSSNKAYAAACAQAIGKRISKTRNWIVALKSLIIVLRVFQDGDPYFPKEVLHAMKRGAKILNLATFREDSNSSPWEYTAFVRMFALYLDERLDCIISGKLQKRKRDGEGTIRTARRNSETVQDMKPAVLLERLSYWQRLMDRAIAIRPTGAAKSNRLVLISLYAILQESFDLYRDFSDGLAHILDCFFHLPYQSCVFAFQICIRATKQYQELSQFFDMCKSLGIGRTSEYPSIQKISDELIETLQEFLKDQASFPSNGEPIMTPSIHRSRDIGTSSEQFDEQSYCSETTDTFSDRTSELGSRNTALEDLMGSEAAGTSSGYSIDLFSEQLDRQSQQEETISLPDSINSSLSDYNYHGGSTTDLVWFDEWPQEDPKHEQDEGQDCWAIELFENPKQPAESSTNEADGFPLSILDNIFDQPSASDENQYNPFLDDSASLFAPASDTQALAITFPEVNTPNDTKILAITFPEDDLVQAVKPTFSVQSPNFEDQDDPFGFCFPTVADSTNCETNGLQQNVLQEQQLWLENQNRIISKHLS